MQYVASKLVELHAMTHSGATVSYRQVANTTCVTNIKGPFIKDVINFLKFLTPPPPFVIIFTK